ncbi:hypothetical protein Tco_1107666 [Tanacetum coccineum]
MVSEGFFDCSNSICRCGSCWLSILRPKHSGSRQLMVTRLVTGAFLKEQKSDAIYSTEAEYIALSGCYQQLGNAKFYVGTLKHLADEVDE